MHPVADRPLSRAVLEIERHVSAAGWDQPMQLFALVPTTALLEAEPALAGQIGEDASNALTPVMQEGLPPGADEEGLADMLARIEWPDAVSGCAVSLERVVLPGGAEEPADVFAAADDPRRHEVRMVAGVLRDGERYGAVRLRSHDEDEAVLTGTDLVPTLCEVLALTFAPGADDLDGAGTFDGVGGGSGDGPGRDPGEGPGGGPGDGVGDGSSDGEESQR